MSLRFRRPLRPTFDTGWLLALTNVQDMVTHELRAAQARGWDMKLTHETTGSGEKKLLVTVEAKSGLPGGNYMKNKFFETFRHAAGLPLRREDQAAGGI